MKYLVFTCLIIFSQEVFAGIRTWEGNFSSSWSEPDNWIPRGLPEDGDSIFITSATVHFDQSDDIEWLHLDNASLIIEVAKTLTLLTDAQFTNELISLNSQITNNGNLVIESGTGGGINIINFSTFTNNGIVEIIESDGDGITITESLLTNNNQIIIVNCVEDGIQNGGTIVNNHEIVLDDMEGHGIHVTTGGLTSNNGKILVTNITQTGIFSRGQLINSDSIIINNAGVNGIAMLDSLLIHTDGNILISNVGFIGISTSIDANTINYGNIEIADVSSFSIQNEGKLLNYKSITIHPLQGRCISNRDTIINMQDGIIKIDSSSSSFSTGILSQNNAFIANYGDIDLRSLEKGMSNFGSTFYNYNTINISNTKSTGLGNSGIFPIEVGAHLRISNIKGSGTDAGISTSGAFYNSGECIIDSSNARGLINSGTLINNSMMTIRNIRWEGVSNNDSLQNSITGIMTISGITDFERPGLFSNLNTRTINHGLITINNVALGPGIRISGYTENSSTGTITVHNVADPLIIQSNATFDCVGILDLFD